jgi:trimethylamine--corrinoid protein Co-methyltransferase
MTDARSKAPQPGRGAPSRHPPRAQGELPHLRNPFPPMAPVFSDDRMAAIHEAALTVLEELGIKVLLPEARRGLSRRRGARSTRRHGLHRARHGRGRAGHRAEIDHRARPARATATCCWNWARLTFQPGAGAPHATDLERGRRPGTLRDFREFVQLTQHFDVLHMLPPLVEPQDVPPHLRHYFAMTEAQLTLIPTSCPSSLRAARRRSMESFEMIRDFRGLSDAEFWRTPLLHDHQHQLAPPARHPDGAGADRLRAHGPGVIVTPFTLMGAMAPITVAGRAHAQPCRGAGRDHADATRAAGRAGLLRHLHLERGHEIRRARLRHARAGQGLARPPGNWRGSSACRGAARRGRPPTSTMRRPRTKTEISAWGCLLAGATVMIHAAGWLEGGLTVSYEKLITDMEMLQVMAELCAETAGGRRRYRLLDALREVQPGGHFFGAAHTMARYQTAFYEPLVGLVEFRHLVRRGAVDASPAPPASGRRSCRVPRPRGRRRPTGRRPARLHRPPHRRGRRPAGKLNARGLAERGDGRAGQRRGRTGQGDDLAERLGVSRSSFYWYFKSRQDLLDALLKRWQETNTAGLVAMAEAPAGTVTAAVCNVHRCVVNAQLFDTALDFAVRDWARRSGKVRRMLDQSDTRRLAALRAMFERFGYPGAEAETRARVLYYMQIGYDLAQLNEPVEDRLERVAHYLYVFTGVQPRPDEIAEFSAYARRHWQGQEEESP